MVRSAGAEILAARVFRRFGAEEAEGLLRKKLRGVLAATEACYNASFRKQLLHVWAATRGIARLLEVAHARREP